jgi:hypothetical protein
MAEVDKKLDTLLKLYEINFNYQTQKEQLVWLASSVDFTFLIVALGWLLTNRTIRSSCLGVALFDALVLVVSGAACLFVWYQNWYKSWAAERDSRLLAELKKFDDSRKPSYEQIVKAASPGETPCFQQKLSYIRKYGQAGRVVFIAMVVSISLLLVVPWILLIIS